MNPLSPGTGNLFGFSIQLFGEGNVFHRRLSIHTYGGVPHPRSERGYPIIDQDRGYPSQVQMAGGAPSEIRMGVPEGTPISRKGYPQSRTGGIPPIIRTGGSPSKIRMGLSNPAYEGSPSKIKTGFPIPGSDSGGVPHPKSGWGYPLPPGYSPSAGWGTP